MKGDFDTSANEKNKMKMLCEDAFRHYFEPSKTALWWTRSLVAPFISYPFFKKCVILAKWPLLLRFLPSSRLFLPSDFRTLAGV